uniref:ataxin-2-like protein isoform X2 n=1 Tax=Myxine glutinosa TaxID=7769 RepID=UPI00358F0B92
MSAVKFAGGRKPGSRPPLGRVRPISRNSLQSPSLVQEAAYINTRMVHVLTSLVGAKCELTVKSGKVFEGIFRTYGPKVELVLEAAHQQKADISPLGPRVEEILDTIVFNPSDYVMMQYKDVDLNFAARGFTDGVIVRRVNGEHQDRELEPWQGGETANDDNSSLETDVSNGWDPNEMFRYNEENYGVKSTYDSTLSTYTTQLERDDSEEFQKREARAEQLAREIEATTQYRTHTNLEDDERSEEDKFGAVPRRITTAISSERDKESPGGIHPRGRYVPPNQRSRDGLGRGGLRQNSPKFGRQSMTSASHRGGHRYPEQSGSPILESRPLAGGSRGPPVRSQTSPSPKPQVDALPMATIITGSLPAACSSGSFHTSPPQPGSHVPISAQPVLLSLSASPSVASSGGLQVSSVTTSPRSPSPVIPTEQPRSLGSLESHSSSETDTSGRTQMHSPAQDGQEADVLPEPVMPGDSALEPQGIKTVTPGQSTTTWTLSTTTRGSYQTISDVKKNSLEEFKRFSEEFKLPDEKSSVGATETVEPGVPGDSTSLVTGSNDEVRKGLTGSPSTVSDSTCAEDKSDERGHISSSPEGELEKGEKPECEAEQTKKSTLNPNAKEFVLNPSAKPFVPMQKQVQTPTPSRPQQVSPSVMVPQTAAALCSPQPLAGYPTPIIPLSPVPTGYTMPVPVSQHKPYRPSKDRRLNIQSNIWGDYSSASQVSFVFALKPPPTLAGAMTPVRSEHPHAQGAQAILHQVSMAPVSAPPLVSYSPAFMPYSPQHFPNQPSLMAYQHPHQGGAVYPSLMQGGSRVLATTQMAPGQPGLVHAPSSSSPQFPPPDTAPHPQTIYVSPTPVPPPYPPPPLHPPLHPHPGSLHSLAAHPSQAASAHAGQAQHNRPVPSPVQHQPAQGPQPQQALYSTALVSQGPHTQAAGYPPPHPGQPQPIYALHHPQHHSYNSPAALAPNQQVHMQSGLPSMGPQPHAAHTAQVVLMAHPQSSAHSGPPPPPPHQGHLPLSGIPSMPVSSATPFAYMTLQPQRERLSVVSTRLRLP